MNHHNRKARLLLKRYLQGKCTPEEIAVLHRWYDQLPDQTLKSAAGKSSPQVPQLLEQQLLRATWKAIGDRKAPVRQWMYRVPAAAAVIGILALSALWWFSRTTHSHFKEFYNPTAGVRRVLLPDSTTVWLNAHSRLRWRDDFASADRSVELEGEGYFDVVKKTSHPFRVLTKDVITEVLGTSFNVEGYIDESRIRVALTKGAIRVTRRGRHGPSVRLVPGQIALVEEGEGAKGTVDVQSVDVGPYSAWTAGGFILQDVPLEDALQRLCRKYGYRLKENFSKDRHKPISTAYHNESFEEILTGLLYVNHLQYSIQDSVITVY